MKYKTNYAAYYSVDKKGNVEITNIYPECPSPVADALSRIIMFDALIHRKKFNCNMYYDAEYFLAEVVQPHKRRNKFILFFEWRGFDDINYDINGKYAVLEFIE